MKAVTDRKLQRALECQNYASTNYSLIPDEQVFLCLYM